MSSPRPTTPERSPTIDAVMAAERAASFTKRSIKNESKLSGLKLSLSMLDLTTLEGKDSPEKVRALCRKGVRPYERDEEVLGERLPSVAAVCVYPALVPACVEELGPASSRPVKIASVATGFPSGQYPLDVRLDDVRRAVEAGADEIDMVISRGLFLAGEFDGVADEIRDTKRACRRDDGTFAHLKVILETGELETLDNVRFASDLAIRAMADVDEEFGVPAPGTADFIKTSTGKVQPAATMPVTLVMLEAIRDWYLKTGRKVGMKPAGGIRTAKQALHYLVMVNETLGCLPALGGGGASPVHRVALGENGTTNPEGADRASDRAEAANGTAAMSRSDESGGGESWLTSDYFRFGASTLANDILRQLVKQKRGVYVAGYDFSEA